MTRYRDHGHPPVEPERAPSQCGPPYVPTSKFIISYGREQSIPADSLGARLHPVHTGTVRELVKADAGPNAHSVAVDPETHHSYLPLQNLNGHPVLREMVVEP